MKTCRNCKKVLELKIKVSELSIEKENLIDEKYVLKNMVHDHFNLTELKNKINSMRKILEQFEREGI